MEDDNSTQYYEEEVTDDEAMAQATKARGDPETDESGDLGFYMPTVLAKNSPSKQPI